MSVQTFPTALPRASPSSSDSMLHLLWKGTIFTGHKGPLLVIIFECFCIFFVVLTQSLWGRLEEMEAGGGDGGGGGGGGRKIFLQRDCQRL